MTPRRSMPCSSSACRARRCRVPPYALVARPESGRCRQAIRRGLPDPASAATRRCRRPERASYASLPTGDDGAGRLHRAVQANVRIFAAAAFCSVSITSHGGTSMHRATHPLVCLLLAALGAAQWGTASANHSFCVTSSSGVGSAAQLVAALTYATTATDETVYIHLEQGTFTLQGDNAYNQDGNGGNANLHVVGGFVPGTSCSSRVVDPASTVIKGKNGPAGSFPISRLAIGQEEGELLIDGIQFDSFADGMVVWTSADSTATVRNVIVTHMGNYDGFTLGALDVE